MKLEHPDQGKAFGMQPATETGALSPSLPARDGACAASSTGSGSVLRKLAAIFAGCAAMSAASAQPLYSVTDLGVLPGYVSCGATRLNDRGDVVGSCAPAVADFNEAAFVWRNGTMSAVGKLPRGLYSYATAINARGEIAGDGDTGNSRPQAWVKTARGMINIFPNNGGNTHAVFLADNGTIGGFYTKSLSGWTSSWKAAIWTPDSKDPRKYRTTDLPILQGGIDPRSSHAIPAAFNQSGQAAGYAQTDQIGQHAAFWDNDAAHSIVDLGVFPNDWSSNAYGMNDLGQVVGASYPPFGSRAVLWNNDAAHTPIALQPLPGDNYGAAAAINNAGQVIGISYYGAPGTWDSTPARQVVWRDGDVFDLQSALDASGAGWTITYASAINNLGQIVGAGVRNGATRAILLTPLPQ